jgi:transposase
MMWLINRLKPDFKTIADFRKATNSPFWRRVAPSFSFAA